MDNDDNTEVDPSSISLFTAPAENAVGDEAQMEFNNISKENGEKMQQMNGKDISYSKYTQRKSAEAASRKNMVERIERLKNMKAFAFAIPQFGQATSCQLSQFIRRFRRSTEAKPIISMEMLEQLFENNVKPKAEILQLKHEQSNQTTYRVLAMELKGIGEEERLTSHFGRGRTEQIYASEDEATDEESTDYEEDDLFGTKDALSSELYDLLEQRAQILTADKHARRMQEEIEKKMALADTIAENYQDSFIFEMPPEGGEEEDEEEEQSSMTCARCRPLTRHRSGSGRLVEHNFHSKNVTTSSRPIIAKKRCGTEEYSFADQSIHPLLSIPSSIPLDVQLQKYLHVISFISTEIEMRRQRTAKITAEGTMREDLRGKFYNLMENLEDEAEWGRLGSPEGTKGIKLSLPFRRAMRKEGSGKFVGEGSGADSDPDDREFTLSPSLAKKRRRMTIDHPTKKFSSSKPPRLEGRRMSHLEYGTSMFDYDSQLMDIGLPLPAIQKVDNVEIAVPSFRRKPALLSLPNNADCPKCSSSTAPWAEIKRLHGELEAQERLQRFRPTAGSTARKFVTAESNPAI